MTQRLVPPQRLPAEQSASVWQSRTHAPTWPQVVPVGQSLSVPQPLQTPPGAVTVQLERPGQKPEFDAWRWAASNELIGLIVPFKRAVYEQVMREFGPLFAQKP